MGNRREEDVDPGRRELMLSLWQPMAWSPWERPRGVPCAGAGAIEVGRGRAPQRPGDLSAKGEPLGNILLLPSSYL